MTKITELKTFVDKVISREYEEKQAELDAYTLMLEDKLLAQKDLLDVQQQTKLARIEAQQEQDFAIERNSLQLVERNQRLAIKQEIIHHYVEEVKAGFQALSKDETHAFIEKLLQRHTQESDLKIVLGSLTKEVLGHDAIFAVPVSEEVIPNETGFILMDGDIEYNYLFVNLVEESRRQLQLLLLQEVFNDD